MTAKPTASLSLPTVTGDIEAFHQLLRHQSVFQGVPFSLISQLRPEMLRTFRKDDVIIKEHEAAENLILILRGSVNIVRGHTTLVRRGPSEIIGEQGVIDGVPYSASAIAHEDVEALAIPAELAVRFLRDYRFTLNLIKCLSNKLREATQEQGIRFATEENMFAAFRSHVHPRVLDDLLAKGLSEYGSPRYIDCAILFADMRSFTSLSLEATPQEIVDELSHYLDGMIEIIHGHGGMVDKFIGDNVMAVWGFDQSETKLAERALDCALEMQSVASNFSFRGQPVEIGCGLNYGTVFCGNVGNERKCQFTVLGQPVNLASRFESLTKVLGSPIVVGEGFYSELPWSRRRLFEIHRNVKVRGIDAINCYALRRDAGTQRSVRWGMIGCGAVTERKSGPAFQKASHSELVMVMRRNPELCEDYARRHQVSCWTAKAEELIHDPRVDAVYIATPPDSHCQYALAAAAAGKPAIVEKPMARTYAECLQMVRAFERAGVALFVAYYRRAFPKFQHLRSVLASGSIGTIERVQLRYCRQSPTIDPHHVPWRLVPQISGGGLLMDLGSHGINIVQFLLGDVPWHVVSTDVEWGMGPHQVEERVHARARIGEAVTAEFLWDFSAERAEDWVIITGEKGEIEFSVFEQRPYSITTRATGPQRHPFRAPDPVQQPFVQMVVNHLCFGTEAPSDGKTAAVTNQILNKFLGRD